jgi:prephenate dehydrogenase
MKIAIVGGSGKMGRWLGRFLSGEGHEILLIGRGGVGLEEAGQELGLPVAAGLESVRDADAVLISVPIDCFEDVARGIVPFTSARQIIMDVTSVKIMPVEAMHCHIKNGRLLGAHPVFGPGAAGISGHNIVLTPSNQAENALAQRVGRWLEARGANVSVMSPEEHDELMAVILGLAHYIAIVSGDTLVSLDKLRKMEAVGGITYRVLLTLIESVVSEDAGFYASLQMNLPNLPAIQQRFIEKSRDWADIVGGGDRQAFIERMQDIRKALAKDNPGFGQAYEAMYRVAGDK